MSFRTLGKIELLCALALFLVQEWILALIFGGLGVFMLFGIKEQPKKQTTLAKKAPAPKKPAPVQKQNSLSQQKTAPAGAPAADAYAFRGSVDKYFLNLLQSSFPDYQLEQKVTLNAMDTGSAPATGWSCSCGVINTGKF